MDTNKPIFIKICIGINSFLEKNIVNKITFNNFSNISSDTLINNLLDIKKSLLSKFNGAYVSFTTIPTMDLDKFNKCQAGIVDTATVCCTEHAQLEYTHDFWSTKKRQSNVDVPPTTRETQKLINSTLHELNNLIRNENKKSIPGYTSHALTVNLEQDTLKRATKHPKAKVRKMHPNSTVHDKRYIQYTTLSSVLVDGIHPTHCTKLKWLDYILERFQEESAILSKIPDVVRPPPNLNDDFFEKNYNLFATENGYSELSIHYNFFSKLETSTFFNIINDTAVWLKIGKRESFLVSPFPYSYPGMTHPPEENCHPIIYEMMHRVSSYFKVNINSVLINRYKDGSSFIPWHQDDEAALGKNPSIYSLTLGATRTFEIHHKNSSKITKFEMQDGTMIVMKGDMNNQFFHRVPVESHCSAPRLNLTFRYLYKPKE